MKRIGRSHFSSCLTVRQTDSPVRTREIIDEFEDRRIPIGRLQRSIAPQIQDEDGKHTLQDRRGLMNFSFPQQHKSDVAVNVDFPLPGSPNRTTRSLPGAQGRRTPTDRPLLIVDIAHPAHFLEGILAGASSSAISRRCAWPRRSCHRGFPAAARSRAASARQRPEAEESLDFPARPATLHPDQGGCAAARGIFAENALRLPLGTPVWALDRRSAPQIP